ncbi:hypothetical protein DRE_00080 [Drechslerella stenobrocha 248]|uniref:Methyltransferase domain-containing protein n=1 Tax=Drechslerella stenobrocha 248 TaxID=1043628 RepID=W7IHN6_9PEZI|nr:hypothetical protein DRE_00080 [Drechslerella stenobrocha 248]
MDYTLGPRIDLFEINDQGWYPQYLRGRIQECLTFCWTISFPNLRNGPSASSVLAKVLRRELGASLPSYTFIDFCAGAGGPTPVIEKHLNAQLKREGLDAVTFVLTDLYPNPEAWMRVQAQSPAIKWVAQPVDAGKAPERGILLGAGGGESGSSQDRCETKDEDEDGGMRQRNRMDKRKEKKVFRMFNLAFHHFDDEGAKRILRDATANSDAIGIFEIQSRSLSGFLQVASLGPLLTYLSPFYPPFWTLGHLFFTYIIPILPFVMVFDGYMSALRTRTPQEILALVETVPAADREGWEWRWGTQAFAKPIGEINYFIGVKKSPEPDACS